MTEFLSGKKTYIVAILLALFLAVPVYGHSDREDFVYATEDSDNPTSTISLGNYDPIDLSLTEDAGSDRLDQFDTTANTICYVGDETINAFVTVAISFSTASASDVTISFGKEQSATLPMDDGDEIGVGYERVISNGNDSGLGSLQVFTSLAPNDCIGLLGQGVAAETFQLLAISILITII